MIRTLLLLFFLCASATVFSQNIPSQFQGKAGQGKPEKPPIELYKIISADRDTTYLDTTLTIQKEYNYNYLRRDNFELLPFSNVGQTYNSLGYTFDDFNLMPKFVAQSHHFNYMDAKDMRYFNVPTPLTELYFKTAFAQGQQLDAFFTVNTNERFNFSIAYRGLRSLGKYQNILTSTGNFRFTTNYKTKNDRYRLRAHVAAQDILNQENGGLTQTSIDLFEAGDPEFDDRGRLDVNFEDAENKLEGLRFWGAQEYDLISKKDSLDYTMLTLGTTLSFEEKDFKYGQTAASDLLGEAYLNSNLLTQTKLENFQAEGSATFKNSILGELSAFIGYTDYNYGYDSVLELDDGRITNRLKGNLIRAGASYRKHYKGFDLFGKGAINISGDFDANYLLGGASYQFDEDNSVKAQIKIHSVAPNFNFLLYQSDYVNYNWQNNFNNVKTQELKLEIASKKLLDAEVSYTGIEDYTYFTIKANDSTPTPQQFADRVDYLKVKVGREFRLGKFALNNTVMFQQALSGEEVFNIPEIVTRQSLYYEDEWFKKAMFMQTGINFKYFTAYNANGYDPVLAEFYVQNNQEIGGYPIFDVFFNAKVRQTRIYVKYEFVNQLFNSTNDHFSAPGYPYRDAVIRFGFVWNFFL
ncbi:putative porin [Aureisphaera galaxeae]|uniref:putative porin n=1 Tax=Aureisphaera galaxeae TaxID=1538023 RepID=UPI002350E0E1|nr:putative porin [Aureisphaera galaxeae]MDC8005674.1 putative porin [Aureisphaera galaxeae]